VNTCVKELELLNEVLIALTIAVKDALRRLHVLIEEHDNDV
jgi:hypothetical protein